MGHILILLLTFLLGLFFGCAGILAIHANKIFGILYYFFLLFFSIVAILHDDIFDDEWKIAAYSACYIFGFSLSFLLGKLI